MPHIQIIVGSTRPGRIGLPIAQWLMGLAAGRTDATYELVDIADFALPVMDEPRHPRLGQYEHEHTRRWSECVSRADGFVLVTPEYNHSFPGSLKNALDYLHNEWRFKPAGFVSYGGIAAGIRSVQHLKTVLEAFQMIPVLEGVNIPMVHALFDADRSFRPDGAIEDAARLMLDRVTFWANHQAPLVQR
jgi:NAD(P)H-dependent FMN reductase